MNARSALLGLAIGAAATSAVAFIFWSTHRERRQLQRHRRTRRSSLQLGMATAEAAVLGEVLPLDELLNEGGEEDLLPPLEAPAGDMSPSARTRFRRAVSKVIATYHEEETPAVLGHFRELVSALKKAQHLLGRDQEGVSAREEFRKLDVHGYGHVSPESFYCVLDRLATTEDERLTGSEKTMLLAYADDTGDGMIDYPEFHRTFFRPSAASLAKWERPDRAVRMVVAISRHGARLPMKQFRQSAAWPESDAFWSEFGGRLTSVGHLQHLQLGRALRRRYVGRSKLLQLDDPALPRWVYAVSSRTDRALSSAQSFLLGLLPHTGQTYAVLNEQSKRHLRFQGITINIVDVDRAHTPLLHGFKQNERYSQLRSQAYQQSPLLREWAQQEEYQQLMTLVSRMCGLTSISPEEPEESLQHFMSLTQQINIERSLKIEIFGNRDGTHLRESDESRILRVSDHLCHLRYQGLNDGMQREMGRLAAGLLPAAIVQHFEDAISEASARRFVLYAAHDNTLMALLSHLGLKNWSVPHFAALLLFELVETAQGFEVKVAYNSNPTDPYAFAEFSDTMKDPLEDRWVRLPLDGGFREFEDARVAETEASMSFESFREDLLERRRSFRTEEEWAAAASPPVPPPPGSEISDTEEER